MAESDGTETGGADGHGTPMVGYDTTPVSFWSEGTRCAGVLYRPSGATGPLPCVVLAHGFSGTMDWIVPDFARRFAAGGIAALIFDYRHLGASDGLPRQLISSSRQRADLRRAVEYVRSLEGIDANRIALWGTSLGGSHVLEVAASDPSIAAVVANVPAIDLFRGAVGRATRPGWQLTGTQTVLATARLMGSAALDALAGALGRPPRYLRVYGPPGRAVFSDPSLAELFRTLEQESPTWRNAFTPRFLFTAPRYRRGVLDHIAAPLLVTLAIDDEVVSSDYIRRKAAEVPHHEIYEYPVSHFEMYHGDTQQLVATAHLDFLRRNLLLDNGDVG
ncbi:alpha/beta hydrolase [Mycolicibacterium lacusdiani]|uniref:alpha/beta hydrolase n=1 Tax=Mycolicibacterium lacusdiani TaxID=2895283 RepID=UPI001F489E4C|nr:alpha/beta hydrolase [Mycolicibacterium lacusdiani]